MTKSVKKAEVHSLYIKGGKNEVDPSYLPLEKIPINDTTVGGLIKDYEVIVREQNEINTSQYEVNRRLAKEIKTLNKDLENTREELRALKELFKNTIESWVNL